MRWIITGDLHGKANSVKNFYKETREEYNWDLERAGLIVLGDFGGNYFFNHRDRNFKYDLCKYPFDYYVVRGNHEERVSNCAKNYPDSWTIEENEYGRFYKEKGFPNIYYFMDTPEVYNLDDKKTLVIPGAYSVDKFYRLEKGYSWFPDEQLTMDEMSEALDKIQGQNFDYVFSHTCPRMFEPYIQSAFLGYIDQTKVDKSMEIWMDMVAESIRWDHWYFGHFHQTIDVVPYKATMLFETFVPLGESGKWVSVPEGAYRNEPWII